MSDKPNFVGASKMYHNKLIQVGLTSIFIAMAVGLFFHAPGAQNISSVKAASQSMPAGDLSVVGQPSLPAATVDTILKSLGSPMSGLGKVIVQASQQTNVDDAFALAVWWTETNDGAAGVGLADRNPGSVRGSVGYPSAFDGYTIYPSYSAAISYWFNMLKNTYVNRGLNTVYSISHSYVGTSSSPVWAGKVVALMLKYRGEAPPVPVVVPHGKRVTEPTVYIHATLTPLVHQTQSQAGTTLTKRSASMAKQASTPPSVLLPTYEYVIIIFALLLALAIVVGVLLLDRRRPIRNKQGDETQGGDEQGGGKPRPYYTTERTNISNIAGFAPALHDARDVFAIPASQDIAIIPFDAAFPLNAGANFRIRRTILLPSISIPETAKPGESPADGNQGGRSTGLLSRYGETHQE